MLSQKDIYILRQIKIFNYFNQIYTNTKIKNYVSYAKFAYDIPYLMFQQTCLEKFVSNLLDNR